MFTILPLTSAASSHPNVHGFNFESQPRSAIQKSLYRRSPNPATMETPHSTASSPDHQNPDLVAHFSGRLCSRCAHQLVRAFQKPPTLADDESRSMHPFDVSYM